MSPDRPHSAKRNFLFNAAFTAVNLAYPLATFAYVSHLMGPEYVGRINLATSLASYFALLASVAVPLYGARETAKIRDNRAGLDKLFSELVVVNLATTAIAIILFLACFLFPGKVQDDWVLFAVSGLFILSNAVSLDWFFQGLEEFPSTFFRNLCVRIASFLLIIICVDSREDYILMAAIGSLGPAVYNLWGIREARKRATFRLHGIRPQSHIRPLALLAGATIVSSAYLYLDGVLLGFLAGDHALGLYSTAIRITRTAHVIVVSLTVALIPRVSRYLETGQLADFTALSQKSIHTIYFLCFPLFTLIWALAPGVVALLAGPEFSSAANTLRVTLPLLPLAGFSTWLGLQILFPKGEEKALLISALFASATNIALNLTLIPRFAENGTAAAAVATEACAAIVLIAFARKRHLDFRLLDGRAVRFIAIAGLAGGLAYAVSKFLPAPAVAVPVSMAVGAVAYLAALSAFRDPTALDVWATGTSKLRAALSRVGL